MTTQEKLQTLLNQGIRIEQIAIDLHIGVTTLQQWRKGTQPRQIFLDAFDSYYEKTCANQ